MARQGNMRARQKMGKPFSCARFMHGSNFKDCRSLAKKHMGVRISVFR